MIAEAPYLRNLAALVLLGTTGAALVDYLFKAQAVETFGRGDHLLRFFALYYAATSLITFVVQMSSSRAVLERFGLGVTTSTPSWALLAGSLGGLVAPGLRQPGRRARRRIGVPQLVVPRRLRAVLHADSGGREAGRQVADRRGVRSPGRRLRRRPGAARAWCSCPAAQSSAILWLAIVCSAGAVVAASRLNRGYIGTLETSLVNRGGGVDRLR